MLFGIQIGPTAGPTIGPGDAPPVAPDAVDDLAADSTLSQRVELSWGLVPFATGYKIYQSTSTPVTTADTLVTTAVGYSYNVTGLTNGTLYYFAIAATNPFGDAALSNEVSETPAITPPLNVVGAGGNQSITVTWDNVPGATQYNVYTDTASPPANLNADQTSPFTDTGLSNGSIYFAAVTAQDASGESAQSAVVEMRPLAAPTASVAVGDTELTITWSGVTNGESYNIYRSTTSPVTDSDLLAADVTSPYTDTGLTNGTEYFYRIRALAPTYNSQSDLGTEDSETPLITAPTGLEATWSHETVSLTWDSVPGATQYTLRRDTVSPVTTSSTVVVTQAGTSYDDTGRTNGTEYFYAVHARDASVSELSSEVSETPLAPPANLAASAGNAEVTLTWDPRSGATAYDLFFDTASGVTEADTELTGATSPHDHTGLSNGTTYYYKVRARNATGQTDLSTEDSATPAAASAEQFPASVAEWNELSTQETIALGDPSYIWLFDEASGNVVDEVASLALAPTGTIEYEQVPTLFAGELGVDITGSTGDRFQGSTTDLQVTTGSFFAWVVCEFGTAPGGVTTICEKFNAGLGYSLSFNSSGHVEFKIQGPSMTDTLTADFASHASETHLIGFGRDQAAGEVYLFTGHERITATVTATGSLSNTGPFRFGRFSSAPMLPLFYSAWWFGAEAEGVSETDWDNYAAYLGL